MVFRNVNVFCVKPMLPDACPRPLELRRPPRLRMNACRVGAFFNIFHIEDMEEREDFVYYIKELDAELLALERKDSE